MAAALRADFARFAGKIWVKSQMKTPLKAIVIVCVNVLILLSLIIFLLTPLIKYSGKLKKEIEAKKEEALQAQDLIKSVSNPQEEIDKIKAESGELKNKLVSSQELPRIIVQLINKSSEFDIEVVSIKPWQEEKTEDKTPPSNVSGGSIPMDKTPRSIPVDKSSKGTSKACIEMIIESSYKALGEYLRGLSDLPIILTIESVHLKKSKEASSGDDAVDKTPPLKVSGGSIPVDNKLRTTLIFGVYYIDLQT
ncbi:MAG: hypothetical protein KKC11_07815 [Candidatus Omnitrophica bacterium]|nr:hypothetical protein [Candidatus Omnitrophota bacterium]